MKLVESISKRLKQLLKEKKMTQYQLFIKTGVPQSTISTIINNNVEKIMLNTLYDICIGLDMELHEFLNDISLYRKNLDE